VAFRFGLETVLKHRKRLEEIAQREYAEAQNAVNEALNRLEAMYTRTDEVRVEIAQAQSRGDSESLSQVLEMEGFINGRKCGLNACARKRAKLLRLAEEKQELLIKAAQEKKVLVKLKDKRLAEYRDWLRRLEAKAVDDQTMTRQVWGKR